MEALEIVADIREHRQGCRSTAVSYLLTKDDDFRPGCAPGYEKITTYGPGEDCGAEALVPSNSLREHIFLE